jgi:hypothetical protein
MRVTKHIAFFFTESRLQHINKMITNTNSYKFTTDIFIHTNIELSLSIFDRYTNGKFEIVVHNLKGINPFYLTWKCKDLLAKQKDDYDIFMYSEDDILIPFTAIQYWLQYKSLLTPLRYNLGFLRIETNGTTEYITDQTPGDRLREKVVIDKTTFVKNDKPYCAFWIYDKDMFNEFILSDSWKKSKLDNERFIRLYIAFGMNDKFDSTVIPLIGSTLDERCKVYHLPNNYINSGYHASVKFTEILS